MEEDFAMSSLIFRKNDRDGDRRVRDVPAPHG